MMRRAQPWLGTLVEISIADAREPTQLQAAFDAAFASVAHIHRLMSFHDAASDVSRINLAEPGTPVSVDCHTCTVLRAAQRVTDASGGIFNICCAPQLVAWRQLPEPNALMPAFMPGQQMLSVDEDCKVSKLAPCWIDLGGIAKGYAVDCAVAALQAHGIANACVNAGGDLRVLGDRKFPVALRSPEEPTHIAAQLEIGDAGLATSGIYFSLRNESEGTSSALVNGRTGQPVLAARSASVHAAECMLADALTKVVMATGDAEHPALACFGASALII